VLVGSKSSTVHVGFVINTTPPQLSLGIFSAWLASGDAERFGLPTNIARKYTQAWCWSTYCNWKVSATVTTYVSGISSRLYPPFHLTDRTLKDLTHFNDTSISLIELMLAYQTGSGLTAE
jgi:hypothetical protein